MFNPKLGIIISYYYCLGKQSVFTFYLRLLCLPWSELVDGEVGIILIVTRGIKVGRNRFEV